MQRTQAREILQVNEEQRNGKGKVLKFRHRDSKQKLDELKLLMEQRERRAELIKEKEEIEAMRKLWTPELEWTTVAAICVSMAFLTAVTLISLYVAFQ